MANQKGNKQHKKKLYIIYYMNEHNNANLIKLLIEENDDIKTRTYKHIHIKKNVYNIH